MSLMSRFLEKFSFPGKRHSSTSRNQLVGLDIGSSSLKAVELRPSGKGEYTLAAFGFEELPPDLIVDGAIMEPKPITDAINRIFTSQRIHNDQVVTSISGHSVIVKKISIHSQGEEDLSDAVRWEAGQNLPFDIDDVNFDFQVIGENNVTGMVDILFVAVKKDRVQSYINVIADAKKIPVIIDVDAFALQNAYEFNYEPQAGQTAALLDIGASNMMINLVSGAEFLFTRDISVGGQRYTEFLQKEFNISHDDAQALKFGDTIENISAADVQYVVDSVTGIICMEIQKTFDFFKSTSTVKKIDRMLISGGAAHTPGLLEALGSAFDGIPVEKFDSFRRIQVDQKQFPQVREQAADIAIAVGLALRSEAGD